MAGMATSGSRTFPSMNGTVTLYWQTQGDSRVLVRTDADYRVLDQDLSTWHFEASNFSGPISLKAKDGTATLSVDFTWSGMGPGTSTFAGPLATWPTEGF